MMFLLALHRIINPLVEIDMAGRLVSLQIKILFKKNTRNSQMKAKLWVQGTLRYNLRSFQLGYRMMSISAGLDRHNPKRLLALRLASHCGNSAATREFRAHQQDVILNAQLELHQLPNMEVMEWGKGHNLGRLIKKAGKH